MIDSQINNELRLSFMDDMMYGKSIIEISIVGIRRIDPLSKEGLDIENNSSQYEILPINRCKHKFKDISIGNKIKEA